MKITVKQLKQLVKEEVDRLDEEAINEDGLGWSRKLNMLGDNVSDAVRTAMVGELQNMGKLNGATRHDVETVAIHAGREAKKVMRKFLVPGDGEGLE